uniref:Uncharacterized protein n=1 Tax=Cavia porcellus TaxID=10141 RepID=H0UX07_CAVPO
AAVLGPTFQDLARNVNQNMSSLSEIFVGRALGYLGGCAIGGVLFDRMNHFLLLGNCPGATEIRISSWELPQPYSLWIEHEGVQSSEGLARATFL